jgi:hypothetical protein
MFVRVKVLMPNTKIIIKIVELLIADFFKNCLKFKVQSLHLDIYQDKASKYRKF